VGTKGEGRKGKIPKGARAGQKGTKGEKTNGRKVSDATERVEKKSRENFLKDKRK